MLGLFFKTDFIFVFIKSHLTFFVLFRDKDQAYTDAR